MSNIFELPDMSTTRAKVAAEVRAEMGRASASQRKMAAAAGIAQPTLSRKLKAREERDSFTVDELDRIAIALGVPIARFFAAGSSSAGPDDGGAVRPKGFEPPTFWAGPDSGDDNVISVDFTNRTAVGG